MIDFNAALERLKRQLHVHEDQQVAKALGLTKTNFSGRKQRGSFPERELVELAMARPELGLDINYVLTGTSSATQGQLDQLQQRIERLAETPGVLAEDLVALARATNPVTLEALTRNWSTCSAADKAAICQLAATAAAARRTATTPPKKRGAKS